MEAFLIEVGPNMRQKQCRIIFVYTREILSDAYLLILIWP